MRTPRTLRRVLPIFAAACALLALPSSASALTVTKQTSTSCDTYSSLTDWSHDLSLPKFAVAGGTFVSATVSQQASITSGYRVESRNGAPRTDTLTLASATVSTSAPGLVGALASLPAGSRTYAFTAYDGTQDFAGGSGASGSFGTRQDNQAGVSTSAAIWAGTGSVTIPAQSLASTDNTLSGNFRLEWDTESTVTACVTYTYTEQITVCIGDYVWQDDTDGIQETSEPGVASRPIVVTDANGVVLGTTTTDTDGRWIVCGLEPSTACVVSVDLPDGWTVTAANKGTDDALDSDGVATAANDATIPCLTPPVGRDLTFDVGIHKQTTPTEAPSPTPARLRLAKTAGSASIASRGRVTFTVRVTNRGQQIARNVQVCDVAPTQLAFVSKPRGAALRNGQLCWTAKRIQPGTTITYRYTMRAANVASRQCVVNRATAEATAGGTASARDGVCIRATRLGVLQLAG